ncbi:CYFA0S05e02168g1_1 [Cyberlindnera fabianii]|uniref:CYFA0S05e02168g1_1 n=1 Tax=Cyberlindnera fabianii TaxID=36022 RepID=A0A061ASI4_CYBFA|nr:Translocation protein SEC66 [Cyberlindnera fabianii]CDR40588.1 CYFA0S05e02168g1_1 [Cyberlindnera fabianii]
MDEDPATENIVKKVYVWTPFLYLAVLIAALVSFARWYRGKKIAAKQNQVPFFGRNVASETYHELTQHEGVNPYVLKAALIRRGAESIRRTIKLKEVTPFMTMLYQKGSIGDDLWERFQNAQQLEEEEIKTIVAETEKYKSGWVQKFVPLLQEVCFNEALRRRYAAIDDRKLKLLDAWNVEIDDKGMLKNPILTLKPTLNTAPTASKTSAK